MDDDATADLLPYLADPDAKLRAMVVRGLGEEVDRDHPDPAMQPRFLAALEDDDASVRAEAATALEAFAATPDARCRRALVAGLDDTQESVRLACADALDQYDARPVEAIPHLQRWLANGSEDERNLAIRLATSLGARAAPLEATLAPLALRGDRDAREDVLRALLGCARLDSTLEIMLSILKDEDRQLRRKAVEVLAERFGEQQRVLDTLEQVLSDDYSGVRATAAEALAKRGLATAKVIRVCANLIESKETAWMYRRPAVEALARYGRDAAPAVPALLRALEASWSRFDEEVVLEAFALLPALADLTLPALVARAVDGDEYAVVALLKMGAVAEPFLGRSLAKLPAEQREDLEAAMERLREAAKQRR
jgi:HEAT repeat protein